LSEKNEVLEGIKALKEENALLKRTIESIRSQFRKRKKLFPQTAFLYCPRCELTLNHITFCNNDIGSGTYKIQFECMNCHKFSPFELDFTEITNFKNILYQYNYQISKIIPFLKEVNESIKKQCDEYSNDCENYQMDCPDSSDVSCNFIDWYQNTRDLLKLLGNKPSNQVDENYRFNLDNKTIKIRDDLAEQIKNLEFNKPNFKNFHEKQKEILKNIQEYNEKLRRPKKLMKKQNKPKQFIPTLFGWIIYRCNIDPVTANQLTMALKQNAYSGGDLEATIDKYNKFLYESKLFLIDQDEFDLLGGTFRLSKEDFQNMRLIKNEYEEHLLSVKLSNKRYQNDKFRKEIDKKRDCEKNEKNN
jgi:hypothetical protein